MTEKCNVMIEDRIDPINRPRADRIVRWFKRHGWKDLGTPASGCFILALLVSPDGERVLKIARDEGWRTFILYVKGHPAPCFPRIGRVHHHDSPPKEGDRWGESYTATIMERLYHIPDDAFVLKNIVVESERMKPVRELQEQVTAWSRSGYNETIEPAPLAELDQMKRAIGRHPMDLHKYNQMVRISEAGDVTLVMIDPYCI
jgi:hypothetical protein